MKRIASLLALLVVFSFGIGSTKADDCICVKTPMYQVPGGDWFHYALVYNKGTPCANLYPTGFIHSYQTNQDCFPPQCGNCFPLGETAVVPNCYFDAALRSYSQVSVAEDFIKYLEETARVSNFPIPHIQRYRDDWTFTAPRVVALNRNAGGDRVTHAVVWKMQSNGDPSIYSYIGLEISDAGPGSPGTAITPCNAVHRYKSNDTIQFTVVPGIVQIEIEPCHPGFIRLKRASNNAVDNYSTCPLTPRECPDLMHKSVASGASVAASGCETVCCRQGRRRIVNVNPAVCCRRGRRYR
jgi:hypothetical protein